MPIRESMSPTINNRACVQDRSASLTTPACIERETDSAKAARRTRTKVKILSWDALEDTYRSLYIDLSLYVEWVGVCRRIVHNFLTLASEWQSCNQYHCRDSRISSGKVSTCTLSFIDMQCFWYTSPLFYTVSCFDTNAVMMVWTRYDAAEWNLMGGRIEDVCMSFVFIKWCSKKADNKSENLCDGDLPRGRLNIDIAVQNEHLSDDKMRARPLASNVATLPIRIQRNNR